ncbi:MAG TPA: DUF1501 domain-containing protein [Planctomycetaceae bacterium]|jgi:uncharacterized protein (DUF1501 family)
MMAVASEQQAAVGSVSRRDFLRLGGLSVLGLSVAEQRARAEANGKGLRRCIFILMTGGASHFETFDPKPSAPGEIRGPFKSIATATPGVQFAESLPLLAQRSEKFAVIRSLSHDAAPIHETGQQLLLAGRLAHGNLLPPSLGSIVSRLLGPRNELPAYAVVPKLLGDTGVSIWQGQRAGELGPEFDPWEAGECGVRNAECGVAADAELGSENRIAIGEYARAAAAANWMAEPEPFRRTYGDSDFGRSCLSARRLVEQGTRFVTVNMFESLPGRVTWDCHANANWAPGTIADYRNTLCPDFDRVLSTLLDDLEQRGLLKETLVVAAGEFGRTPRINQQGGRDHWPGVWSALIAGGGIAGGQVLGASDARGMFPTERPVAPAELAATILHTLGVDLSTRLALSQGSEIALADADPISELVSS